MRSAVRLMVVRYAEIESLWMGETPKNLTAIFRAAREERAVLFFDEADAIASRRSTSADHGFQRESNTVVNVLLQELEQYNGVVIFATNLAANFDPAFERRIRTHVLFEMPGEDRARADLARAGAPRQNAAGRRCRFQRARAALRRERWRHPERGAQGRVDGRLSAGPDGAKRIHQRDFEAGIEDVIAGKRVMQQSLFANDTPHAILENPLAASLVAGHRLMIIALAGASAALIIAIAAFVVAVAH